ncbi:MAG: hypothetical protein OXJ52_09555 [Oligoflexia bacterium]|nr:hypothetical protein [Oligoflexia bacterium]
MIKKYKEFSQMKGRIKTMIVAIAMALVFPAEVFAETNWDDSAIPAACMLGTS